MNKTMPPSIFRIVALLSLLFVLATLALAQQPVEGGKKIAEQNKQFQDKALDLEMWKNRFEVESREVYAHRDALVGALKLKPGQRVADVGAGTGAFMATMLKQVADNGHYFAVDISPRFLELIRERAETGRHANVTTVLGATTSITLPANTVDAVFICDTYHHFEKPEQVLASIHKAMKKGGTLVVVDFSREPGKSSAFSLEHIRASQAVFRKEIETAGFTHKEDVKVEGLKENYVMRFVK